MKTRPTCHWRGRTCSSVSQTTRTWGTLKQSRSSLRHTKVYRWRSRFCRISGWKTFSLLLNQPKTKELSIWGLKSAKSWRKLSKYWFNFANQPPSSKVLVSSTFLSMMHKTSRKLLRPLLSTKRSSSLQFNKLNLTKITTEKQLPNAFLRADRSRNLTLVSLNSMTRSRSTRWQMACWTPGADLLRLSWEEFSLVNLKERWCSLFLWRISQSRRWTSASAALTPQKIWRTSFANLIRSAGSELWSLKISTRTLTT